MRLAEFEKHITDAAEALNHCAQDIKRDNAFEVEYWLQTALSDLEGCREFATEWANEQEAKIAAEEEGRAYEIIGE